MKMKGKNRNKTIKCVQMDICYYGDDYLRTKHFPKTDDDAVASVVKSEDGYWYGLDLGSRIPINVHLFFSQRRWNAYCESCKIEADGSWNHWYDPNIVCNNIKVIYAL